MVNFRGFVASSCVILVLQFTVPAEPFTSVVVSPGADVTLPCGNALEENCGDTMWLLSRSHLSHATVLVRAGRLVSPTARAPRRLSVTAGCSLLLQDVTAEDVGRYGCRHVNESAGRKDAMVDLSVINMTEQTKPGDNKVRLTCSVTTYGNCSLTVTWLHVTTEEEKDKLDNKDNVKVSDSVCLTTVVSKRHRHLYAVRNLLKCKVTDRRTQEVNFFMFNSESTGKNKSESGNKERKTPLEDPPLHQLQWWWYFALAVVVLAIVVLSVIALVVWTRNRRNKSEMEETMADAGDGVAYASIAHPPGISSQIRGGECTVTYSTVNLSSSPAMNSATEPANLYATVNKPKK